MTTLQDLLIYIWQNHRGKILGLAGGFFFGVLILIFGFFKALFLAICALVGLFIGKRFDEKKSLRDILERLLPPQH